MKAHGARKKPLNTKIEPNFEGSKKSNVIKLPSLELFNLLINTIKDDTQCYYNMRMVLGLECA